MLRMRAQSWKARRLSARAGSVRALAQGALWLRARSGSGRARWHRARADNQGARGDLGRERRLMDTSKLRTRVG